MPSRGDNNTPCYAGHGLYNGDEEAVCLIWDESSLLAHIQPDTWILRFLSLGPVCYSASGFQPILVQGLFCRPCRALPFFLLNRKYRVHSISVGLVLKFLMITLHWSTPVSISHSPSFADLLRVHLGVITEVVRHMLNKIGPMPALKVLCICQTGAEHQVTTDYSWWIQWCSPYICPQFLSENVMGVKRLTKVKL